MNGVNHPWEWFTQHLCTAIRAFSWAAVLITHVDNLYEWFIPIQLDLHPVKCQYSYSLLTSFTLLSSCPNLFLLRDHLTMTTWWIVKLRSISYDFYFICVKVPITAPKLREMRVEDNISIYRVPFLWAETWALLRNSIFLDPLFKYSPC